MTGLHRKALLGLGLGLALLFAGSVCGARVASASAKNPELAARAALVMNAVTGEIVWSRNPDQQLPPASTTKVMTSILALESNRLDEVVSVSSYAAAQPPSKINLFPRQTATLRALTYSLLLNSANDAAVVIAEALGGSVPEFAEMMNGKAYKLGALHTQFQNPNGLPDPDHLTTARDLALIFRHALSVPGFREIASTRTTEISVSGAGPHRIALKTHNRLLGSYIVPVIGKTGFTRAAGRCFVGAAELDGREIIVVLLGSSNLWGDTRRLIEFGLGIDNREAARLRLAAGSRQPEGEGDSVLRSSRTTSSRRRGVQHASLGAHPGHPHAYSRRAASARASTQRRGTKTQRGASVATTKRAATTSSTAAKATTTPQRTQAAAPSSAKTNNR